MKTLEEFIQRLQNDAAFEKQAQAFDHGDDLIAFVKSEGYDFTLEQLMSEFGRGEKPPAETDGQAPAPADLSASTPPRPDDAEFPRKPEALSSGERDTGQHKSRNDDFTREQPLERLQQPMEAMPRPGPEAEPPAGLFSGGGGRHRGFSPQKLKSISEEDP
jgi:predicted ribosomally synthesized peptide with nif11-like leader